MGNTPNIRFKGFTDDWEQRKLSEVAEIVGGGTPSTNIPEYWDGDIDWYAPAEINDQIYVDGSERKITKLGLEKSSAKILPADITVLFTSRAGIGKTAILRRSGATNQGFQSMVLNDETNPYFVFSISKFIKEEAERVASGSTFAEVSGKMLGNLAFMFPTKKEQDKIGEYFSNLDNLITLHQRKCDETKKLKKFMLQKMFPKKDAKKPEIRFAGFTDDWEQRKFGELYEKVNEKNNLSFGVDKIISVANMYFKEDVKESNDGYMRTYNVMRLGDIAFEGNKSKNFSHGRFVENTIGDGIVSHVFDVFRPVMNYDLLFWKYLINNENVMGRIMTRCTKASTMMTNLVAKDFLNEDILVPIIEEQTKIGECIDKIDHLITLHQRKCDELKEFKKYMLQNMFPQKG